MEAAFNLTLSLNVDALQSTTGEYKEYQEEFQKFEKEVIKQLKSEGVFAICFIFGICLCFILWLLCRRFEFHSLGMGKGLS